MDVILLVLVIYFALVGAGLGTISGLTPGVHVNTLALILVSSYPLLGPPIAVLVSVLGVPPSSVPLLVSSIIVSAAVVHSFLDFVPSIFLGAPDEEKVLSILPGHRMLLGGRGMEAVLCAATGSLVGSLTAIALCLPLSMALGPPLGLCPYLDTLIPFVLVASLSILIWSERGEPEMTAVIDAREGSIVRSRPVLSLARQVPVHGEEALVVGRLVRRPLQGHWIETGTRGWRVRARSYPRGNVTVRGAWTVKGKRWRRRCLAVSVILVSGLLGFTVMNARLPLSNTWVGMGQSILFPLLTGLFGVPTLLLSMNSHPIPTQEDVPATEVDMVSAVRGALSGGLVGWFPGITSTCGTVIGNAFSKGDKDSESASKRFITMVSAVGTSATVFSVLALAITQKGRTGAMLAVKSILGEGGMTVLSSLSTYLPLLLVSALVASICGFLLTRKVGRFFARKIASADLRRLTRFLLVSLIILVIVFTGLPGLVVLSVSVLVGLVPPLLGISRVHLTGCLLIPILMFFLGLEPSVLDLLS